MITPARKPAQYSSKTDAILDSAVFSQLDSGDCLDLAMACLDQAGLPIASQGQVLEILRAWMPEFK